MAPLERRAGGTEQAGGGERHRALHVIPRVGVAAGKPRDRTRRLLRGGDRERRLPALLLREDARNRRQVVRPRHALPRVAAVSAATRACRGLTKYIATLLPTSGLSTASATRVIRGRLVRSQTSNLWYADTAGWSECDTPTAH